MTLHFPVILSSLSIKDTLASLFLNIVFCIQAYILGLFIPWMDVGTHLHGAHVFFEEGRQLVIFSTDSLNSYGILCFAI